MNETIRSFRITEPLIKSLCGVSSYRKGESMRRAGKVTLSIVESGDNSLSYEAAIKDNGVCRAAVHITPGGQVSAECACSIGFTFDQYCKHVAAALLQIMVLQRFEEAEEEGLPPESRGTGNLTHEGNPQLVSRVLELFGRQASSRIGPRALFESREILSAEVTITPFSLGIRRNLLGAELRIGWGRRYAVNDIREFLTRYEQGQEYACSRHFTYAPDLYCFSPEVDAFLKKLIEVRRSEKLQREAAGAFYTGETAETRRLTIPPYAWPAISTALPKLPLVQIRVDDRSYEGFDCSEEVLPLRFQFDQDGNEGISLAVQGLQTLKVLEEYGMALLEGRFYKLKPEDCARLAGLQRIMTGDEQGTGILSIAPREAEPFMERVVPGLMKLGEVRIAKSVSDRMVQSPLSARIYLDRVSDRLLAGLEFQYGDIVINPLEQEASRGADSRILIREGEKEERILELMETAGFVRTESGFFLQDEELEYDFLKTVTPRLEQLAKIYATSAVKTRLFAGHTSPKISADLGERTNWLEFRFQIDGIPESEIRGIIESLREKRRYHKLANGALLPMEDEEYQEIIRFLNEVALPKGEIIGSHFRLPVARALHLMEDSGRNRGSSISLGKPLRLLLERLRNPDLLDHPVPESLAPVLRDYQHFGFQWLKTLAQYGFGGILADDMGLGKTLQSIAFLLSVLPEIRARKQPALIVSPASLMYNWLSELRRFAPGIRAAVADGTPNERSAVLRDAGGVDAIIVSYPLLRRDIARYSQLAFHTLILDEAQAFKNYTTQTAKAVKSLRAECRFALTGTPVENSLEELWSIYDAVFPGLFPDRRAFSEIKREEVSRRARPFLLRRMKRDVLQELPEKIDSMQISELLPEQKKLYAAYLAKLRLETLKHLDNNDFEQSRIKILAGLTRLRQICCHPGLFIEDYSGQSAKLEQLLQIVEDCRSAGRRPLIFSQFTGMLGMIGRELGTRGIPFFYLDGNTPARERTELCSRFNEGERELFLISLKAGGTGLNLTGADTVILYDLWWNPAVEQQAEDRAHRIGQKKVVQVIRLVAQGTVEEKMYELQQKKKTLIDEVVKSGGESISSLTEQEIRELLSV
ncbi:DEAD/DEAH box helicase [Paenibacillus sp. HN-1]|uniref:DEAD/DEAH box helicase n=1 Tax=Paenibacillus TaxID=44249 RepID=UPI001CA9E523|nr:MULTISPECIES: DEAD/DEAH box helicase [Paenibacillus]MBY9078091.1 DEAD/DEAH box helicase [Paenibacillus sp. CGMCC 1.18879]MBY9083832.1 DEAD/DEAH box helicase [Paenibacillus sinensis]